jgi:hypothetical protein
MENLPDSWKTFLEGYTDMSALENTLQWVESRRQEYEVYPPAGSIFRAFELTPPEQVRAVIIGQDPYHEPGQAQGLAFSVPEKVKLPPSLKNIFKEYSSDTGNPVPDSGDLTSWAQSGVLLMNLAYMRKDCIVDRVKDFLGRYGSPAYVDQDVLNHLYNKTAVIIDSTWNCVLPNRTARNGAVLHCFGIGRMFSGSMRGWDAFNGIWYEYYSKCVLARKSNPCGFLRRLWWNAYGFFFPCERFLRILTFPFASYRAEQLAFMQFRAWVYVHRKWGRK